MANNDFQARLDRIGAAPQSDAANVSATEFNGRVFPRQDLPLQPKDPNTAGAKFTRTYWAQIVKNLATGFVWMFLTGLAGSKYSAIRLWIEESPTMAPDLPNYMTAYYVAMALSVAGFGMVCYLATDNDGLFPSRATAPMSVVIGGVIGGLLGLGPATVFEIVQTYQASTAG